MSVKLDWTKQRCGGIVAVIPPELGGSGRKDGYRQSTVHIIPRAFGGRKCRMRISNHALQPWNFHHQMYDNIAHAKRTLNEQLLAASTINPKENQT